MNKCNGKEIKHEPYFLTIFYFNLGKSKIAKENINYYLKEKL
jgi:hypothetical protein